MKIHVHGTHGVGGDTTQNSDDGFSEGEATIIPSTRIENFRKTPCSFGILRIKSLQKKKITERAINYYDHIWPAYVHKCP